MIDIILQSLIVTAAIIVLIKKLIDKYDIYQNNNLKRQDSINGEIELLSKKLKKLKSKSQQLEQITLISYLKMDLSPLSNMEFNDDPIIMAKSIEKKL